jgi:ABC-2 type transport system ATP-binding protein
MEAITTRGLTKRYTTHFGRTKTCSLDRLDLCVEEGETFGFIGRNGAGKTTTIKILCGLLRQTQGEALIFGLPSRARKARTLIGYLPENPYFYEYLTPRETIDFYGRLQGLDKNARERSWGRLAELLDLNDIAAQRVRSFSKGMRQRLGFAVALVGDPELVILDEPMSGLDPMGRRAIRELILRLRDEKKTVFFSSHVLSDVEQVCSRVGILVDGHLRAQGRLEDLLQNRVSRVEITVQHLTPQAMTKLNGNAKKLRLTATGYHFDAEDMAAANRFVRNIHEVGGEVVELLPVRESLEEYFMRHQQEQP